MLASSSYVRRWRRYAGRYLLAALAAGLLVRCGGETVALPLAPSAPDTGSFTPAVLVIPSRVTVQAGDTVTFEAIAVFAPGAIYQWRRNGVNIVGATSATYSLVGANLGDDGAQISVLVTASKGTATAAALLQVSPLAPVVYQDGDFPQSNWSATLLTVDPPASGSKYSVSRADTGGNPGAYRSVQYEVVAGPSSINVAHSALTATYDAASLGGIYAIDFGADCSYSSPTPAETSAGLMLEQAGRRFATASTLCGAWLDYFALQMTFDSMGAGAFRQLDGPACAANEACPDFSATGAPIRFGLVSGARIATGERATTAAQGIDNWKVTVWRR
jgi:hypothetical protein